MRKTFQKLLSKTLLAAFIFLFAASPVFAQTDWTPPTGPATGNNVEPPINTSRFGQTKNGDLTLESDLILSGQTPTALDPGPWVFSNWLTSFFGDDVIIGSPLAGGGNVGPFPLLFINGTLRYSPKAVGTGAIAPLNAEELADGGYNNVLIGDAQGNIRWTDADNVGGAGGGGGITVEVDPRLPFGTAVNQVLKWNGTAWIPGAAMPDGVNQNDILIWDDVTNTWIVGAYPGGGGGTLPTGTQGQTMLYNGTGWEATNRIKYTQSLTPPIIPSNMDLNIGDLASLGNVNIEDGAVEIKGNSIVLNGTVNYDNALTEIDGGSFSVETPNTDISSENITLSNVSSNPLAGRFLFSKDDNGKVEWNKNLVYARETFFGDSFYDVVSVLNEPGLTPGQNGYLGTYFVNEGATYLKGNTAIDGETVANEKVTIKDPGDLYLEGIEYPPSIYWEQTVDIHGNPVSNLHANTDKLKQLCIDTENFKVVYCDSPDPKPPATHEYVTVTCTPTGCDHGISLPYEFEEDATIDIEYCAGGGGGGGGGKGYDLEFPFNFLGIQLQGPHSGPPGEGGGGGGGGVAGECNTYNDVDVVSSDVIDADIGTGGNGGTAAYMSHIFKVTGALGGINPYYDLFNVAEAVEEWFMDSDGSSADIAAGPGNQGLPTNVTLTGNTYPQADGGIGGAPGSNGFINGNGLGGNGGLSTLPPWHDGSDGEGTGNPYGGQGGDGESPEAIQAGGATSTSGGGGGGAGISDTAANIAHNGGSGKPGKGGGGGSGGYGDYLEDFGCGQGPKIEQGMYPMMDNPAWDPLDVLPDQIPVPGSVPALVDLYDRLCRIAKGGRGGDGGAGYLKIHNFPIAIVNTAPPTQFVYEAPNTSINFPNGYTFDFSTIPASASTVTIEVWGGGGGGGNVSTGSGNYPDKFAGGGGAGGYVKHTMPVPNSGTAIITVGAGGVAGAPGNNGNGGGNSGTNGGLSKFTGVGVTLQANGGFGGSGNIQNTGAGGNGGAGFTIPNGIAEIAADGEDGQDGSATASDGGLGGDAQGTTNAFVGDGGQGGVFNGSLGDPEQPRNPTGGKKGTVRITWN